MAIIERATLDDYAYLSEHDRHVTPQMLRRKLDAGEILVARQGGAVVGWLRYGWFWDEIPFLNMLYVEDAMRGQGIGRALVEHWETQMREAGHARVMTSTLSNESAQHFYRKFGYRDAGALLLPDEAAEILFVKVAD